jgi:citronellol/citronellal dehydrogenase
LASINQKGFDTVLRTNLMGGFLMAREVFNQSMSKHGGAIVNMLADMWGGMPGMGHSGAARSGMDNLTKTAAFEWGYAGVRVNAVAPGWIASSGMDTYEGAFKAVIPTLREHVPLKRIGTESEVSAAIVFLLSPAAAFISGSTLRIDGAASLGGRAWPIHKAQISESYNGFHRAYLPDVLKDKE